LRRLPLKGLRVADELEEQVVVNKADRHNEGRSIVGDEEETGQAGRLDGCEDRGLFCVDLAIDQCPNH
jgi:hypothetical protein